MRELVAEREGCRGRRNSRGTRAAAHALERAAVRASVTGKGIAVVTFLRQAVMPPLRSGVAGLDDLVAATLEFAADGATIAEKLAAAGMRKVIAGSADRLRDTPLSSEPRPRLRAHGAVRPSPVRKPLERPAAAVEAISSTAHAVRRAPCECRFIAGDERRLCFIHQKPDVIALLAATPIRKPVPAAPGTAERIAVGIGRRPTVWDARIAGLAEIRLAVAAARGSDACDGRRRWRRWRRRNIAGRG